MRKFLILFTTILFMLVGCANNINDDFNKSSKSSEPFVINGTQITFDAKAIIDKYAPGTDEYATYYFHLAVNDVPENIMNEALNHINEKKDTWAGDIIDIPLVNAEYYGEDYYSDRYYKDHEWYLCISDKESRYNFNDYQFTKDDVYSSIDGANGDWLVNSRLTLDFKNISSLVKISDVKLEYNYYRPIITITLDFNL